MSIPPEADVGRTFIGRLGLGDVVKEMMRQRSGSVRAVASALVDDPRYKEALQNSGSTKKKLHASDIYEFLTADSVATALAVQRLEDTKREIDKESSLAKLADGRDLALAQGAFAAGVALFMEWRSLSHTFLHTLKDDMQDYIEEKEAPPRYDSDGNLIRPMPPLGMIDNTRKAVLASAELFSKLIKDPVVHNVLNAQNVTVKKGLDQDELMKLLRAIARNLSVAWPKMLEAYSLAVTEGGGTKVVDVVPLPPEPEWRKAEREELAAGRARNAEAGSDVDGAAVTDEGAGDPPRDP